MLNGQVLALKYRPKNFDELIGQETVAITLKNTLKNHKRLAHAYLFSGLRGSGKTSSARIFAKTLLCEKAPVDIACEECASCQMANNNSHIDIIEIDGASNRKIEDIRDLIQQTKYRPSIGNFKIFIIDEVHMLTKEAFNALLKTLEEPPEYVKFILATTDPMKLPQTILSRTQHFHFKRINPNLIKLHLQKILKLEKVEFEEEALDIIIRSGEGSLRDTLTILQQAILFCDNNLQTKLVINMLGLINPDILREIFQLIKDKKKESLLKKLEEVKNFDIQQLINQFVVIVKENLIAKGGDNINFYSKIFSILNEAKQLLFIGADTEFVLYFTFLQMLDFEAENKEKKNIREINENQQSIISQNIKNRFHIQKWPIGLNGKMPMRKIFLFQM
jgi:DNA polymerase-3 subunit gamma/tau